jgi:hypothetical protein
MSGSGDHTGPHNCETEPYPEPFASTRLSADGLHV